MSFHNCLRSTLLCSAALSTSVVVSPALAQSSPSSDVKPTSAPSRAGDAADTDIVVTGYRQSLRSSQQAKRNAPSVVEAITPEDLGKFSDNSIADELQRVPGVQIDRNDAGRAGDHVSIRGLGSNFVTTTVNGRTPGSYGQEGLINLRSFPVDILPSEILSNVLVYKTASAEHVESGLGGTVDLQTLRPLDYKSKTGKDYFGTFTGRILDNSGTSKAGKGVSGIVGGKFAHDTIGIYVAGLANENVVNIDYLEVRPQIDTVNVRNASGGGVTQQQVIFPSYPDYGRIRKAEKRKAVSAGVQWKPSDSLEVNLDYTYSKFDRPDNRDYTTLQLDGGNVLSGVFEPGGITIQNGAVTGLDFTKYTPPANATATSARPYVGPLPLYYDNFATTQVGGLSTKWHQDKWTAAVDFSLNKTQALQDIYIYFGDNIYYPSYTGLNYSSANKNGPAIFNNGAPGVTNPAQININSVFRRYIQNRSTGASLNADLAYEVNDAITLKAGVRRSETTVDVRSVAYFGSVTAAQSAALRPILFPGGIDVIFPGQNIGINNQPVQDPRGASLAVPGVVPALTTDILTGSFANTLSAPGPWGIDAARSFRVKEITSAAYGQADFKGMLGSSPLDGNVGLRVVKTDENAQAFQTATFVDANNFPTRPSAKTLIQAKNNYTTWLPSLNLTLHPNNNTNVRLGISRTMSRPEYEQIAPINVVSVPDPALQTTNQNSRGTGAIGNPQLKPETAWNYDFTAEYYTHSGGSFVFSTFYKKVSNFIGYNTVFNTQTPGFGSQLFNVTTAVNFSSGRVFGFEIGGNVPFDKFLPIKGFGVQANFTYVDSKIRQQLNGQSFAFPGSSKYNANGTIYYSHKALDLRASYVYRSNYLSALPALGIINFPTYTNGYGTLDASATLKINKNLELIISGSNLTKTARRDYLYSTSTFLNYYTRPRQLVGAVRLTF